MANPGLGTIRPRPRRMCGRLSADAKAERDRRAARVGESRGAVVRVATLSPHLAPW